MIRKSKVSDTMQALQKKMQTALQNYKADNTTAKHYFTSMKEISSWLIKQEK